MTNNLRARWMTAWREAGGHPARAGILFDDLSIRLHEGRRHHHTFPHIEMMSDLLEVFRASDESKLVHFPAVKMMIWYHHAVYNPDAHDNEVQSARLWALVGRLSYLDESFIGNVVAGILATIKHQPSNNPSIQVLCDLDLAILGQPEPVFDRYEEQIRLEYADVPEDKFRNGRREILKQFLDRSSIYQTNFFRERYEAQAQKNIERSIDRLG